MGGSPSDNSTTIVIVAGCGGDISQQQQSQQEINVVKSTTSSTSDNKPKEEIQQQPQHHHLLQAPKLQYFEMDESSSSSSSCGEEEEENPLSNLTEDRCDTNHGHRHHRKTVSFSHLEVREYNLVIGDHPCCNSGCPLSLGWDYNTNSSTADDDNDNNIIALDEYEANRPIRRTRQQLRTTQEERQTRLEECSGYSEMELRRAQRKLHRARSCSAKLCEKMNESFFQDQDQQQQQEV